MNRVIEIIKEIQATSSKNEKEAIIKANSYDELFTDTLKFLLDGNVVTGINKKKLGNLKLSYRDEDVNSNTLIGDWRNCMRYLKHHNTGKNEDVILMQIFIQNQPEEHREFYEKLITKTLRLGCDSKTVNKAIPRLIPTWDVMLGSGQDKLKLKKDERIWLSKKLNGNRCSFINGKLISRQGKEFTGLQHIIDEIRSIGCDNFFLDGELIRKNTDEVSDGENFRIGTGVINSDAETKEEISFVIFDILNKEEFESGKFVTPYSQRKIDLQAISSYIITRELEHLGVVLMVYEGTDHTQIDKWLQYAVDNDWEGLMLNKDAPYKNKRTTDLIKIKKFHTADLMIMDVEEGDGRLKGTLGAFVVAFKGNLVNVGSGFSDSQRNDFWTRRDELIGKIVEVKYKEVSKNKDTGLESLQFPVFVRLRTDKEQVSYE